MSAPYRVLAGLGPPPGAPYGVLLLAGSLLAGLAACTRDPAVTPSPLPPDFRPAPAATAPGAPPRRDGGGHPLDEVLAYVEGEYITRRRLALEAGPRTGDEDPVAYERALQQRLKRRARTLLFAKEGERIGISVQESRLDAVVRRTLDERVKEASERVGEPVTVEEWLAEQGQTMTQYRQSVRETLQARAYIHRMVEGIGGPTRPVYDTRASPAEIRRIYWSHPGAFDVKAGVRFAAFQVDLRDYMIGERGYLEAEEAAGVRARAVAAALGAGEDPEALAVREGFPRGAWLAPEAFVDQPQVERIFGSEAAAWIFDPARPMRDTMLLASPQGPQVLALLERREGQRVPYEEAYPRIEELVRLARERRLEEERLIHILTTRNVVWPPELAQELLLDARRTLEDLRKDPVVAAASFR